MLQTFVGMSDETLQWNMFEEEIFTFTDLPYAQVCVFVNILLEKNRHLIYEIRFKNYGLPTVQK